MSLICIELEFFTGYIISRLCVNGESLEGMLAAIVLCVLYRERISLLTSLVN